MVDPVRPASYQSVQIRWKGRVAPHAPRGPRGGPGLRAARRPGLRPGLLRVGAALLLSASAAFLTGASPSTPYEDTKHRFSLRLPAGWSLAPRFGDLWGMTFERTLEGGMSAALTVHVDPVPAADLPTFMAAAESGWAGDGAPRVLSTERGTVAGQPAIVRESEQAGRRVRAYFVGAGGRYYHLRFEVSPAMLRQVEADWAKLVGSFAPGRGGGATAPMTGLTGGPTGGAAQAQPLPPGLVGTWRGKAGVTLRLDPQRTFSMGGKKGRYTVEGDLLVLVVPGRSPLRFTFVLDGDALSLSTESLPEPAVYARVPADDGSLGGVWRTQSGSTTLKLEAAGRFEMGPLSGRWDASEDRLVLRGERGEEVTYRYGVEGDRLTLSGGDLESPLTLARVRKK